MKAISLSLITTILLITSIESANAGSETSPVITPATDSTLTPISSNPTLNQQAGFIQNNGSSFGYPNCNGICGFAITKVTHTGNVTNVEAIVGGIWQISSPEITQATSQRENLATQTDITLTEKLADAIEKNQPERVNAIAIILSKRLGYSDYRQYLLDVSSEHRPKIKNYNPS